MHYRQRHGTSNCSGSRPAETLALVRHRLGLRYGPSQMCGVCGKVPATDNHMLSCLAGGLGKKLSDSVVDAVATIIRGDTSAVTKERLSESTQREGSRSQR